MDKDKKELPLATEIIRTLKKIIFALIVTNVLTVGGFLWYISLPVEVATETTTYEGIEQNTDNSGNNVIGGDIIGDTESGKDDSSEDHY